MFHKIGDIQILGDIVISKYILWIWDDNRWYMKIADIQKNVGNHTLW